MSLNILWLVFFPWWLGSLPMLLLFITSHTTHYWGPKQGPSALKCFLVLDTCYCTHLKTTSKKLKMSTLLLLEVTFPVKVLHCKKNYCTTILHKYWNCKNIHSEYLTCRMKLLLYYTARLWSISCMKKS